MNEVYRLGIWGGGALRRCIKGDLFQNLKKTVNKTLTSVYISLYLQSLSTFIYSQQIFIKL